MAMMHSGGNEGAGEYVGLLPGVLGAKYMSLFYELSS